MVKKNKIGKFQFWFGIVILVVAIGGFIISAIYFKNISMLSPYSNELIDLVSVSTAISARSNIFVIFMLSSLIGFFTSILFITQGMINKSEVNK